MSTADPINKIIAPFLVHGLCRDEAEVLQMLAQDYVQRQIKRYAERVEYFRAFYSDYYGTVCPAGGGAVP